LHDGDLLTGRLFCAQLFDLDGLRDHVDEVNPFALWRYIHWSIDDPAATQGSDDKRKSIFRRIRGELATRIRSFVREN
jgi:hypothetical protein